MQVVIAGLDSNNDGRFEWQVVSRVVVAQRTMPPTIARSVIEVGTDDPTVVQVGLDRRMR